MATEVEKLIVRLEVSQNRFEKQMQASARAADRAAGNIEKRFASMNRNVGSSIAGLGRTIGLGLAAVAGSQAIGAVANYSAKYRDLQNALKVTGLEGKALAAVFSQLSQIAMAQGTPLDALVTLYSRASVSAKDLNASQSELIRFSEGIAVALRVQGTSATEAQGALLQLSQALGNGKVQAEEYNSLLDGGQAILQATANGMVEAGGSVSALTKLVKDGQVSSEAFFRAFLAGSGSLAEMASKTEGTVSQAYSRIETALINLVGELDKTTGASSKAVDGLNGVASAIESIPSRIESAVAALENLRSYLAALDKDTFLGTLAAAANYDPSKTPGFVGKIMPPRSASVPMQPQPSGSTRFPTSNGSGTFATDGRTGAGAKGIAKVTDVRGIKVTVEATGAGGSMSATSASASGGGKISLKDYAVPADAKKGSGGRAKKPAKERADEYEREIEQIQKRTAALTAETAAQAAVNPLIDDYGYAVNVASVKQDLLNAAQEAGVKITPEVTANIQKLAEGYAAASVASDKLRESQDQARQSAQDVADLGRDALSGFISDMRNGTSAAEALGNALDRIADKLLDSALDSLFDTSGKSGGGILGGIGKLFGFANGGIAARGKPIPTFARGGVSRTASIFGEAGPEAAVPLPDGRRIPVDLKMPSRGSARGGGIHIGTIDARGAHQGVGEEIRRALAEYDRGSRARTVAAYNEAKRRGSIR